MSACTWPVDPSCLPDVPEGDTSAAARVWAAVDAAVGVLWALTGRRFGVCPVVARPCPPGVTAPVVSPLPATAPAGGPASAWSGVPWVDEARRLAGGPGVPVCEPVACSRAGAVLLPGPVHTITGFIVDGADIALSSLHRDGDRVWRAGHLPWPRQDLSRDLDRPGTWAIRYLRGVEPPPGAAAAVGALAREFHAACNGGRCRLPRRTQSVNRQGVSVTMVDPKDIFAEGATGLPEVDLWVRAHNPHRLAEPAVCWSPDSEVW